MLEILIPTYSRPKSAARAIELCLTISDPRLTVRCNSNGYEQSLEKFRNSSERLVYSCFEKNLGVNANILHLLTSTNADYVMLLSDEDWLDERGAKLMLDFLDKLPNSVKVVSCSIFEQSRNDYFSLTPVPELTDFTLNSYLLTGSPIPSYMSGLIFSTDALRALNWQKVFCQSMGNAYPHLSVVMGLLEHGRLRFFNHKFVVKGNEACFGGDSFSHRLIEKSNSTNNADLNPLVYGPRARARQFFYQDKMISDAVNANYFAKSIAKLYKFIGFYKEVKNSDIQTIIEVGCDIRLEVVRARDESIIAAEWSGGVFSRIFIPFVGLPWSIGMLICITIKYALRLYSKSVWYFIQRCRVAN